MENYYHYVLQKITRQQFSPNTRNYSGLASLLETSKLQVSWLSLFYKLWCIKGQHLASFSQQLKKSIHISKDTQRPDAQWLWPENRSVNHWWQDCWKPEPGGLLTFGCLLWHQNSFKRHAKKWGGMVRTGRENVAWRQHPKYPSWIFMSWDKQGAYPRQQNYQNCCTVYAFYDLEGDFL